VLGGEPVAVRRLERYSFDGYRRGTAGDAVAAAATELERASCGTVTLRAAIDLATLPELASARSMRALAAAANRRRNAGRIGPSLTRRIVPTFIGAEASSSGWAYRRSSGQQCTKAAASGHEPWRSGTSAPFAALRQAGQGIWRRIVVDSSTSTDVPFTGVLGSRFFP
jgi:hypothetical protein